MATDKDENAYGSIRYTRINGQMSNFFNLDPVTGWVTVASNKHDFDRDHGSGGNVKTSYIYKTILQYLFI